MQMEGWGRLSHLYATVFLATFPVYLVYPAITDVVVEAVCSGGEECSYAIYLAGGQQAITGVGAVLMMPLIGKLSDVYGRKNLLTIPLTLQIIPLLIMAWNRSRNFFYVYFTIKTFTGMVVDGGVICLSLGYLADNVKDNRVGAFAVMNGILCIANVCGTLAAGLLSISRIYQVAAALAIVATIYMRVFLKDKIRETGELNKPILNSETETSQLVPRSSEVKDSVRGIMSPKDVFVLLKSSTIFALATSVSFFTNAAEAGYIVFLMTPILWLTQLLELLGILIYPHIWVEPPDFYFLKARFGFDKNQFSVVLLITNLGATLTNVVLMPFLGSLIGEETLLCFALFNGFLSMLLDSIAWATWVPYFSALLGMFFTLSNSCIRSIVSKQIGPNEQGIALGSLMSITALAYIAAPLIFSPLSAVFLSDKAPFHFPGFCILCIGFSYLIALVLSVIIKMKKHSISRDSNQTKI